MTRFRLKLQREGKIIPFSLRDKREVIKTITENIESEQIEEVLKLKCPKCNGVRFVEDLADHSSHYQIIDLEENSVDATYNWEQKSDDFECEDCGYIVSWSSKKDYDDEELYDALSKLAQKHYGDDGKQIYLKGIKKVV